MMKATMIAVMTATPAIAVAPTSICRKRSSRPSPRSPRMVSLRPPNRNTAPAASMIASDPSPAPGRPAAHWAASIATPRPAASPGTIHFECLLVVIEHLLDRRLEEPRKCERERKRRDVSPLLDRVDRLTRHVERRGERALRHVLLRSQLAHPVLHLASPLSSAFDSGKLT